MENIKFKLTGEVKTMEDGTEVYRIEALKDFGDVKVGDLGGFVEKEDNLSFEDDDTSWIYDDAVAYGESEVKWESIVSKGAQIKNTQLLNESSVANNSIVEDSFLQSTRVRTSVIKNTDGFSVIFGQSNVEGSDVVLSSIIDTEVIDSFIGSSSTSYGSKIHNSHIEDSELKEVIFYRYDSRTHLLVEDFDDELIQ